MTENRYSVYLPDTVKELQEFQKLGRIEGGILEDAAAAKETLEKNQWILTAERSGLLRLAKMMGFLGAERLETGKLREEILSRWSSRSPYTRFHLQDWLDGCLGEGNYRVNPEQEAYRLQLVLELRVKEKRDFLERYLRKIVPANLILDVDLNVNTHDDLHVMLRQQIHDLEWTHEEIPYEDLTPYRSAK